VSRAIEAIGLSRAFGPTQALAGLDLAVDAGEMVALLGPDGAGKTTAMRLLAGVIRADSGSARLAGIDVAREAESARAHLGYVPQRFGLYGELTVWENLRFLAEVTEAGRRTTVFAVEIAIDNPAGLLKPGMPADVGFVTPP